MRSVQALQICLRVLLSAGDVVVAIFLIFGGWNAMGSHPLVGYACLALGPGMLYFSSGLWTRQRFKILLRAVLYWGAFISFGVSAAVLTALRVFSPSHETLTVYVAVFFLLVVASLSTLDARFNRIQHN